jgi:hypothetical protein
MRSTTFLWAAAIGLLGCEGKQRDYSFTVTGSASPPSDAGSRDTRMSASPGSVNAAGNSEERMPGDDPGDGDTTGPTAPGDVAVECALETDGGCELPCAGCRILGACVGDGVTNPDNQCQVCDPRRSASDWSSKDGIICDDGLFCTVDDACSDGQCAGIDRQCDDGIACNGIARCDENTKSCLPGTAQCPNNTACDTATALCVSTCAGCVIAGSCVANGAEEPGNPCRICNAAVSQTAYTPVAGKNCGLGPSECSLQDTCDAAGICQPNPAPVGSACGNDSSSQCDQPDTCNAQGQCVPNNVARGTRCGALSAACARPDQCDGAGSCQSRAAERIEICNGLDDDCDSATDEGFDFSADPNNCGGCGRSCTGGAQCTNGTCSRAAGAQCTTGSQCQSGVCTGGFCCGTAPCAGPCSTCQQGTGTCVNAAPRTPCGSAGSHLVCIGGTCTLPTVRCDGVNRQVTSTMACCESRDIFGTATESYTSLSACREVGIDNGQATTPITCDERNDCPTGELCCLHNDVETSRVSCVPASSCAEFTTIEVCSSPVGATVNCGVGTCGNYVLEGFVPGWQFCNL